MKKLYKVTIGFMLGFMIIMITVFPLLLNAQIKSDTCRHEVLLMDDFGDGWGGGSLTLIVHGDTLLNEVTLDAGATDTVYFYASQGAEITTDFVCGDWCFECSYEIVGGQGNILASDGMDGEVPTGIPLGACSADCNGTTSVAELDDINVRLFPNPANEKVNIESSTEILQLSLLDCSGRVMESFENISHNQFCISVSQYDPGTYLLRIDTEQGRVVRKVIVNE